MFDKKFKQTVERLTSFNMESWYKIHTHIGFLISGWAKRKHYELDWVATSTGLSNSKAIQLEVYSSFSELISVGKSIPASYEEYQNQIIGYSEEIIKSGFSSFYALVQQKNSKAWEKVNEKLYIYAARCLSNFNLKPDKANEIYQESVVRLYKRVSTKDLQFESSKEFKTYFFRILGIYLDAKGGKNLNRSRKMSQVDCGYLVNAVSQEGMERVGRHYHMDRIIKDALSNEEVLILKRFYFNGDTLSEIARSLLMSEADCRHLKLQALCNIAAFFQEIDIQRLQE